MCWGSYRCQRAAEGCFEAPSSREEEKTFTPKLQGGEGGRKTAKEPWSIDGTRNVSDVDNEQYEILSQEGRRAGERAGWGDPTDSLREREDHFLKIQQLVHHIAELWKDFPETLSHLQALNLLSSTSMSIQHAHSSFDRISDRTNIVSIRAVRLHSTLQRTLLSLNNKFVILCRPRSDTPDLSYERQFSEAKFRMVECLTKCAHQE